jgi:glycosyltransferase involved in cell wall biosynthesis
VRIAIYHHLPPGGARRFLEETLVRSSAVHEYDVFFPASPPGEAAFGDGLPARARGAIGRYPVAWPGADPPGPLDRGPASLLLAVPRLRAVEREVARRIHAGRYDLVLVHGCRVTQAPDLLRHLRIPSILYVQEPRRASAEIAYRTTVERRTGPVGAAWRAGRSEYDRWLGRADRRAAQAATALLANSFHTAEAVWRVYGRDAAVCYCGVDEAVFRPGPPADPGPSSVLAVGALDPSKGHDFAIRAVGAVPEHRRPVLEIVFERRAAGYEDELRALADRSGVTLRLHAGITDAALVARYRNARATLGAARLEPFGLTVLESLSTGTPVVAACEGGYRETVADGRNGYLVERTPEAMAAGIERVLSGELGRDAEAIRRTVIPRWTWDATVDGLHRAFAAVVGAQRDLACAP